MPSKKKGAIVGWSLSGLVALFLIAASAAPKFVDWPGKADMFAKMGIPLDLAIRLGILEIALAVLFVIPRTGFIGAVLLTGYLGGAVFAHVRIGDPFYVPIILGVVIWIALGLRQPAVFAAACGKSESSLSDRSSLS